MVIQLVPALLGTQPQRIPVNNRKPDDLAQSIVDSMYPSDQLSGKCRLEI